jgi:predicted transcriptional regulator
MLLENGVISSRLIPPALAKRKRWIKCVRNRNGRAYSLTDQGQEIVDNMPSIAEEIHGFIKTMLSS